MSPFSAVCSLTLSKPSDNVYEVIKGAMLFSIFVRDDTMMGVNESRYSDSCVPRFCAQESQAEAEKAAVLVSTHFDFCKR